MTTPTPAPSPKTTRAGRAFHASRAALEDAIHADHVRGVSYRALASATGLSVQSCANYDRRARERREEETRTDSP
jgi:hypothetical protein